jgi:hypothetical protein
VLNPSVLSFVYQPTNRDRGKCRAIPLDKKKKKKRGFLVRFGALILTTSSPINCVITYRASHNSVVRIYDRKDIRSAAQCSAPSLSQRTNHSYSYQGYAHWLYHPSMALWTHYVASMATCTCHAMRLLTFFKDCKEIRP